MKIYKLTKINGYSGDPYYHIPSEETLGYYMLKEKAESHPEYQKQIIFEAEEQEKVDKMTDEEYEEYSICDEEPYGYYITEIDVIE